MLNENKIPQISDLPTIYRVTSTSCIPAPNKCGVVYRVGLYHDDAQLTVQYTSSQPDIRLKVDLLVSVRWKLPVVEVDGAIQIARLVILEHPIKGFNLFKTVPPRWVKDRHLVERAKDAVDALPSNLHQLINAVLWDGKRFCRYCVVPSSIDYIPMLKNQNLLHTVEVTEIVKLILPQYPTANQGITLAAALLHDVGKAAGYSSKARDCWELSEQGRYVGNRYTVIAWLNEARVTNRIILAERDYLSLMNSLISAPDTGWMSFMPKDTVEAKILDVAMRLSEEPKMIDLLAVQKNLWNRKPAKQMDMSGREAGLMSKA